MMSRPECLIITQSLTIIQRLIISQCLTITQYLIITQYLPATTIPADLLGLRHLPHFRLPRLLLHDPDAQGREGWARQVFRLD